MTFAKTCRCGRRVAPGQTCQCGSGKTDERTRMQRQPWRQVYRDPAYKRNRLARYRLAGGRCEACRIALRGELHPDGVAWQCDHRVEPQRFTDPLDANAIENLRCYCTGCHAGARKPQVRGE